MNIEFHAADVDFKVSSPEIIRDWLVSEYVIHSQIPLNLNIIFCSDKQLLDLNKQYLNHDYLTDILTFEIERTDQALVAELYLSIDRIRENADNFSVSFERELHRVMIHGLLHLVGFNDGTEKEKKEIRQKEELCLANLRIN